MHISRHIVQQLVLQFGAPVVERWSVPLGEEEFAEIKQNRALKRAHDVTLIIERENELVVIRKPQYPPNAYRAPSGGIHPEESFLDGAVREAKEETGLDVEIKGYPLCVLVSFTFGEESAQWTTHVMAASVLSGELDPQDADEIASARWINWVKLLDEVNPILVGSGSGGLAYRARIHEKVYELRAKSRPEGDQKE